MKKLSVEHRKKISEANKKRVITVETREKHRLLMLGSNNPNYGRKWSEQTLEKMRLAQTGNKSHSWKGGIWSNQNYRNWIKNKRNRLKQRSEGSHSYEEWTQLKNSFNNMCLCCKRFEPEIKLTEDHIIPLSKGGGDSIENIQPLCKSCNSQKYFYVIDFRPKEDTVREEF